MARTRRSASSANLPLTPEQLLELDNVPAATKVPSDIASRLSTRKLVISGARGLKPEKSEVKGAYEVTLPGKAVVGLPGWTVAVLVVLGAVLVGTRLRDGRAVRTLLACLLAACAVGGVTTLRVEALRHGPVARLAE